MLGLPWWWLVVPLTQWLTDANPAIATLVNIGLLVGMLFVAARWLYAKRQFRHGMGYVLSKREAMETALGLALLAAGWVGLLLGFGPRELWWACVSVGVAACVLVGGSVAWEKWAITGSLAPQDTQPQTSGNVTVVPSTAALVLSSLTPITGSDPVQFAAYRQTHMDPRLFDTGGQAGMPAPLRDQTMTDAIVPPSERKMTDPTDATR